MMHGKNLLYLAFAAGFLLTTGACSNPQEPLGSTEKPRQRVVKKNRKEKKKDRTNQLTLDNFEEVITRHARKNPGDLWVLETDRGRITVQLSDAAPLHKANIIYLTDRGYFSGTFFHRVARNFVIQAGNTDAEDTQTSRSRIGRYSLPAEIHRRDLHYTGTVAMARSYVNNPNKRSSPFEFYIVTAPPQPAADLDAAIEHYKLNLSPAERGKYLETGGAPHLDGEHTIIGRVVEGLDVAWQINRVEVDKSEWPLENVVIRKAYIKR